MFVLIQPQLIKDDVILSEPSHLLFVVIFQLMQSFARWAQLRVEVLGGSNKENLTVVYIQVFGISNGDEPSIAESILEVARETGLLGGRKSGV